MPRDKTRVVRGRSAIRGGSLAVVGGKQRTAISIGTDPVCVGRDRACDLTIDDSTVSAAHAELVATPAGVRLRDLGSKNGTFVGAAQVGEVLLIERCRITLGHAELDFVPKRPERLAIPRDQRCGPLVGAAPGMRILFDRIRKVAPTDLTLLVLGETGTGKELVAKAIHDLGARSRGPFVVVDCGAIPASLAESVLFGHEKGAFTGAESRRPSPFEEASGGTLFLDELGELPLDVQPKLLRVLAERRVKPVGSNSYRDVDVRIVAATRRNLLRSVNEGAFRSDLYFRVAEVRLELPALRERIEDVPLLVRHFLEEKSDADAYDRIPPEMMERLVRHDWPGNVRELKSAINVALALAEPGGVIDVAAQIREAADAGASPATMAALLPYHSAKQEALERFERQYFAALASLAPDNITEMARRAGLQRSHVRKYLVRHLLLGFGSRDKQRG